MVEELFDYKSLRKRLEKMFEQAGISQLSDIDWIITSVTGKQRSMLPFLGNFTEDEITKIMQIVELRLKHIPLDHILGKSNFMGRNFKVNEHVLIPRLDTEVLVETVISRINTCGSKSVLDIGTGSGIIAETIALETDAKVTAVDISQDALNIAKENAKNLNADVTFLKSDLFENLADQKFDLIVSNPPYIETDVIKTLQEEVKDYEPHIALDGGTDGLDFYKKIINEASKHLTKKGYIFFEIGYNQANAVSELLKSNFDDIKVLKDYEENDRVVYAKLK